MVPSLLLIKSTKRFAQISFKGAHHMDNPFGDNLFEQFMIYDQFFATEVPCPWCGTAYTLDVQEGEEDDRHLCEECGRVYSVNWVTRIAGKVQ